MFCVTVMGGCWEEAPQILRGGTPGAERRHPRCWEVAPQVLRGGTPDAERWHPRCWEEEPQAWRGGKTLLTDAWGSGLTWVWGRGLGWRGRRSREETPSWGASCCSTLYWHPPAQNFPSQGQFWGNYFRLLSKKDSRINWLWGPSWGWLLSGWFFHNPLSLDFSFGLRDLDPFNLLKITVLCSWVWALSVSGVLEYKGLWEKKNWIRFWVSLGSFS